MADDWSAAVDPDQIGAVLTDTAFGHAWATHLVLAAALVAVVAVSPRDGWAVTSLVSAALLASLGLVGHAAMQTGAEGALHRANHAVHLMAAGASIGGLVPFAMCLRAYERDDLRKDAVRAMAGFSFWGQLIVAAIVLTGVVNIALTSHRPPLPPTTPYRALLVAKLVIVAIMILLALVNRFVLAPRLKTSTYALTASRAPARRKSGSAASSLRSSVCLLCSIQREARRKWRLAASAMTGRAARSKPHCPANICSLTILDSPKILFIPTTLVVCDRLITVPSALSP